MPKWKSKYQVWLEKKLKEEKARVKKNANKVRLKEIRKSNLYLSDLAKEYREELIQKATRAERYLLSALLKSEYRDDFLFQEIIYKKDKSKIIGFYICDFVIQSKNLVIEIDGGYHEEAEQRWKDAERTLYLQNLGYFVYRVKNEDIYIDKSCSNIIRYINNFH